MALLGLPRIQSELGYVAIEMPWDIAIAMDSLHGIGCLCF